MKYLPSPSALLLLSLGLPREWALYLVPSLLLIILIQGRSNLLQDGQAKLLLIVPLVVPAAIALITHLSEASRLAGLLFLIVLFPYRGIGTAMLGEASILLIAYVCLFQIGILCNLAPLVVFRDSHYPIEINPWGEASLDFGYEGFRAFRAAGLFYNPNVMAIMVFFPYVIFALKQRKPFVGVAHSAVAGLGFLSLVLTGCRVYLIAFILIFLFCAVASRVIRAVLALALLLIGLGYVREFILADFIVSSGSMAIKLNIFSAYLQESVRSFHGMMALVFGGTYDLQFDADVGYIIGAWGICGLFVSIGVLLRFCSRYPGAWRVMIPVYVTSFGNSLYFSLLTSPLLALIILAVAGKGVIRGAATAAAGQGPARTSRGVRPRQLAADDGTWMRGSTGPATRP